MGFRLLSPEGTKRMMKQAESNYRPPQIVKLKEEIEGEMRAAELIANSTGVIDEVRVQKIVKMKLELDRLYGLWAEGELE